MESHAQQETSAILHGDYLKYCPPPPDTRTIFKEMIAGELRAGRLTALRRARIVRYASQIGLSAVEAGRMLAECQREALDQGGDEIHNGGLRFVDFSQRPALSARVAVITGILLIVVWLLR